MVETRRGCSGEYVEPEKNPAAGIAGQAIDYALKRWEALTQFVENRAVVL